MLAPLAKRISWASWRSSGLTARSRPPEVWASARRICVSSETLSAKVVNSLASSRLLRLPPGTWPPVMNSMTAGSMAGTAEESMRAVTPDSRQRWLRCPRSPKPVTSVPARVMPTVARAEPGVLSSAICLETFSSSSAEARPLRIAVEMIPVPSGLVRRR